MKNNAIPHIFAVLVLIQGMHAAELTTWPSQYKIRPWEVDKLTAADVVGPDGIVYPDFTGVGVTGGIPDINNSTVRATYTVFNVVDYGAEGDGVTNDDAAVAAAATAARNHLNASSSNKAILYFPAGTYILDTPISFTQSNIVIDGDGPASTIIKLATDTSQSGNLFEMVKPANYSGYLTVTAFAPRGTTTITLSANPATNTFAVGSWVRIHQTSTSQTKTIATRFNNPDNGIYFGDPFYHTPRLTYAKVTAINSTAKTITLDRTLTHDLFVDDSSQARRMDMMEYSGIQDLALETVAATATVNPVRFENAANCWIKNFKTVKARDWPIYTVGVTRFEIRDSQFLGTWKDITLPGGTAYLGWCEPATDSLMDNVQASDLRHMAIFMFANRCVIRNSSFSGRTVQSPQLHGRFPHDNLIEGTTFNHLGPGGTSSRGITHYGSDGGYSMDHGANGPRNVYYNNTVLAGAGTANFSGISEGFIFAYNRILKNEDTEAKPSLLVMDRTFDFTLRGNIFQSITSLPVITLGEMTCTGWDITDNKIYGSNGHLFEGDSEPALVHNNRFFSAATSPDAATTPETASIYAWQKTNANTARLVVVVDERALADNGATTEGVVTRVKASTASSLTVNLSTDIAGLSFPATVEIPAGQTSASFTLTGVNVSGGEKIITLTATAPGLMNDIEKVSVLDLDVAQPNFGAYEWPVPAAGLPANWKASNYGIVTAAGSQSYNSGTNTWSISGGGVATETFHASLSRSGRKFVYQTIDGDGEIRARITSATGDNQVGLMISDDEANHTDFIWVESSGRVYSSSNDPGNGLGNGCPTLRASAGSKIVPSWLRLKRVGSVFTAYRSTVTNPASESDWTVLATVNLYPVTAGNVKSPAILDRRMHYGMFINSGSATTTASASFTGVQLTGTIISTIVGPTAPTALSANLVGNTQANLTWTDNSDDETGFEIEGRIGSSAGWTLLATVPANTTAHSRTGLLDGATYHYRVRAVRSTDGGASAFTGSVSVSTPLTTPPIAPSSLSAAGISDDEIQLSWNDNAHNESGYQIERSSTSGSGFSLLVTLGADAAAYLDSGLPDGVRYYYRVRAVNALGNSAYSAESSGVTQLRAPVSPSVISASGTEIRVGWTDTSTTETSFSIRRSTSAGGPFVEVGSAAANATTFTDTTVVSGTTYYYQIFSRNAVATSAASPTVSSVAVSAGIAAFYEPFAHSLSPTTIVSRAGSGTGYSGLWLGIAGTAPRETLLTGSLSAGRTPGLGNQLRMSQTSANSRIALVLDSTAKAVVTPPAQGSREFWVSYLVRTPSSLPKSTAAPALVLSTSGNTQIIRFVAQSGGANNKTGTQYAIAGSNLTTVSSATNSISANTSYCYIAKVTVTDTDGNTANGLESIAATLWQYPSGSLPPLVAPTSGGITRSATTVTSRAIDRVEILGAGTGTAQFFYDEIRVGSNYAQVALPPPPLAPTNLVVSGPTSNSLVLTWTDAATDETGYKVQRATAATGPYVDVTTSLPAGSTTYTDTGLAASTTYYYRVRATNTNGSSDPATGSGTTSAVSISGTITLGGSGLGGVTVSDGTRSATTAANGTYTLANVPGGNYTLTPTLPSYTFSPASLAVAVSGSSLTGQNFSATFVPSSHTLAGTVTVGGAPLPGATITVGATTVTTDSSGAYAIPGLVNGSYTVTPAKAGYTFSPSSASVTISGANPPATNFAATLITYSVSGTVTHLGSGLAGVTVGDGTRSTTSASDGTYTLVGVPPGDHTLVASKANYNFTPTSVIVSVTNTNLTGQNFSATYVPPTTYTLSGVVLNDGNGLGGVTVSDGTHTTITASDGSFAFTDRSNGAYVLSATRSGYRFLPATINATISEANSSGHTFTASAPAAPTNLAATPGPQQIALTWSGGAGVSSYTVKRATVSGGPYTPVATGLADTSHTDTGLTNGTTYYYVVSATNLVGESPDSAEVSSSPRIHTWAGGAGNWSSNANPGWNTTGVPNTVDAYADATSGTGTITVNGTYTLGSLKSSGRTFATNSGLLVFDVSTGNALLDAAGSSPTLNVDLQLNDNLKVTNLVNSGSQTVTFNGVITSSGKLILENTGSGTDARSSFSNPANTFAGGIDIGPRTILRSTASGALGDGLITRTATDGTGSLNFFTANQTHLNDINLGSASSTGTTLSINNAVQVTLSGILSGTMGSSNRISLNGGTLILNGPAANTWTGQLRGDTHGTVIADKVSALPGGFQFRSSTVDTTISLLVGVDDTLTGLLSIEGSNAGAAYAYLPRIGLKNGNPGTVTISHATALNLNNAFGPGGTDLAPTVSLVLHSGDTTGTLNVATQITDGTNPRNLHITGAGTVRLSRAAGNTYDGTTTVVSGTLIAANTSGSATGTGAVRIGVSGAATTLSATGQTSGSATVTGFASTSALAVGQSVSGTGIPAGTTILALPNATTVVLSAPATTTTTTASLTFDNPSVPARLGGTGIISGNVTFSPGATLAFTLDSAPGSHDRLDITGSLNLGASPAPLVLTTSNLAAGVYPLVTAQGGITGTLPAVADPEGFTASLALSGDNKTLNLTLTSLLSPLQSWYASQGLPIDGSQAGATPAGDGVSNLLKYAYNMIGNGAGQAADVNTFNARTLQPGGSAGLPYGTVEENGLLQITFIRRKAASNPGITYTVEFSNDLTPASWTSNPSASEAVESIDSTFERVTITDSPPSLSRRFARVRVGSP